MPTIGSLIILGAGGLGRLAGEIAELSGLYTNISYLDDKIIGASHLGYPIIGTLQDWAIYTADYKFIVAIGDNNLRNAYIDKIGHEHLETLVHPSAVVSKTATIGPGSIVLALASIGASSNIAAGCIVDAGTVISHDVTIGNCARTGVNSSIDADCTVANLSIVQPGHVLKRGTVHDDNNTNPNEAVR